MAEVEYGGVKVGGSKALLLIPLIRYNHWWFMGWL